MAAVSETKGHAVHRVRPGTPVFSRTPTFDDFIESHEASRKSDALGAWAKASVNVVSVASAKSASKGARKAPGRRDSRYWTDAERSSFEEALKLFKTDYHAVAKHVKSRTAAQVRSHARKYYRKLIRDFEKKKRERMEDRRDPQPEALPEFSTNLLGGCDPGPAHFCEVDPDLEHLSPSSTAFDLGDAYVDLSAAHACHFHEVHQDYGQDDYSTSIDSFLPFVEGGGERSDSSHGWGGGCQGGLGEDCGQDLLSFSLDSDSVDMLALFLS